MGWRRGPGTTEAEQAITKKRGRTYIPDREEMNERNRPMREAAEAKKHPPKVRKKRK
jgi:hypothetical protein